MTFSVAFLEECILGCQLAFDFQNKAELWKS